MVMVQEHRLRLPQMLFSGVNMICQFSSYITKSHKSKKKKLFMVNGLQERLYCCLMTFLAIGLVKSSDLIIMFSQVLHNSYRILRAGTGGQGMAVEETEDSPREFGPECALTSQLSTVFAF